MANANQRYRLTSEAAQDLLNIARYTIEKWGFKQSRLYAAELEKKFNLLAVNLLPAKRFSENLPDIMVWHNKFHSVYYTSNSADAEIIVIAVLHQKTDVLRAIRSRRVME